MKELKALGALAALLLLAALAQAGLPASPGDYEASVNDAQITFIDVGQGDSIFIRSPLGRGMLIDAGGELSPGRNAGAEKVVPFLKSRGVRKLDYLVISHPHPDHTAGLAAVMKAFPVGELLDAGAPASQPEIRQARRAARKQGGVYRKLAAGDRLDLGNGVKLEVLAPPPGKLPDAANDSSLVLKLTYGDVSVLLPGDAETEQEKWLVAHCADKLASDLLKSPHHGSATSAYAPFLERVKPAAVVISCAMVNEFGHPHAQTLAKYKKSSYKVYRTDYNGDVTVTTDGSRYKIEGERP
jgi:competence protein ComEC